MLAQIVDLALPTYGVLWIVSIALGIALCVIAAGGYVVAYAAHVLGSTHETRTPLPSITERYNVPDIVDMPWWYVQANRATQALPRKIIELFYSSVKIWWGVAGDGLLLSTGSLLLVSAVAAITTYSRSSTIPEGELALVLLSIMASLLIVGLCIFASFRTRRRCFANLDRSEGFSDDATPGDTLWAYAGPAIWTVVWTFIASTLSLGILIVVLIALPVTLSA